MNKCDCYCEDIKAEPRYNQYYINKSDIAIGNINCNPYKNIIIDAETIKLYQKDLDIVIDISKDILDKIENIEVNGFKFIKEKSYE